ncbi:AAA family ATPase [Synechococcus sp. PCC 6312]|uniref:AAA family ATPase n=1 Tax=Synechococcus sp. (strain ATCC 27167 / PCC 6312) TaxID=195253 RepID=UPI0002D42F18|nr:AAA family ATPase [Synechococcus sp. PCC 6312]
MKHYAEIFTQVKVCQTEADVEQKIIIPFLQGLGYAEADWLAQSSVDKLRPDFIIKPSEATIKDFSYLIIEVKAPTININNKSNQLKTYLTKTKAIFGLISNGKHLRLFYHNPFQPVSVKLVEEIADTTNLTKLKKLVTLLNKRVALSFIHHLYQRQQQAYTQFSKVVTKVYPSFSNHPPVIPQTKPMIITVFNNKGGVGKTTLTINLGAALAKLGKRVLLIDIDAQANLSIGLRVDPLKDVEDVGKKDITHLLLERDTTLQDVIHRRRWGDLTLDIVPSHIRLADMEPDLMRIIDVDRVLSRKLNNHGYDFVLIDPPPSFSKVNAIALVASTAILIPTELSSYPIRALEYVLNRTFIISQSIERPIHVLGITVSRYDKRNKDENLVMKESLYKILNRINQRVDILPENTWTPQLLAVSRSTEKKCPVQSVEFYEQSSSSDKDSLDRITTCYENLAKNIIEQNLKLQESN